MFKTGDRRRETESLPRRSIPTGLAQKEHPYWAYPATSDFPSFEGPKKRQKVYGSGKLPSPVFGLPSPLTSGLKR